MPIFYPYDGNSPHDLASVTKSIMTTLIGIAADQGKLKLDQPMLSFFAGATLANRDASMEKITVRHLTNMSNGLESLGMAQDEGTLAQMEASDNWVQFALDRKVVSEPGTQFVYDSPGMHLLSAMLQKATGMTALEFARQNLFEPLGIRDVIWPADPQGVTDGWSNILLHPRDAAKIGYLFLNKGRWDGKQIVSKKWVEEATRRQIDADDGKGYGYGWWTAPENTGEYFALATNPIHLASVRLEFDESFEAVMQIAFDDGRPSWMVPVGLDGVYRMCPGEDNLPAGGRGRWVDADTFTVQIDTIGNRETFELGIDFKGDLIDFSAREGTYAEGFTVEGELKV